VSRRTVIAACEASLPRLGTDYIDVYFIHRAFTQTAIDETLRALDDLVSAGKIRYIGSSGASGWQLVDMLWCAHDLGLNQPAVEQTAHHVGPYWHASSLGHFLHYRNADGGSAYGSPRTGHGHRLASPVASSGVGVQRDCIYARSADRGTWSQS
jgi:hypothetical protein